MITETKTERGRTVLSVNTNEEFQEAVGLRPRDYSIDIEVPQEMLEKHGIFDSAEAHVLLDETDQRSLSAFPQGSLWRERPPQGECLSCATVCAGERSPVPHQRQKEGGRSLHQHPSRAARRARRGHAGRSLATFVAADAGNPCQPASNTAFQVKSPPQRRGSAL